MLENKSFKWKFSMKRLHTITKPSPRAKWRQGHLLMQKQAGKNLWEGAWFRFVWTLFFSTTKLWNDLFTRDLCPWCGWRFLRGEAYLFGGRWCQGWVMTNALAHILKTLQQCESNFTLRGKGYSSSQLLREGIWTTKERWRRVWPPHTEAFVFCGLVISCCVERTNRSVQPNYIPTRFPWMQWWKPLQHLSSQKPSNHCIPAIDKVLSDV